MKNFFITIVSALLMFSCSQKGYRLEFEIIDSKGIFNDASLFIERYGKSGAGIIGRTDFKDGKCILIGDTYPSKVYVNIETNEKDGGEVKKSCRFPLFLENSEISVKINIDEADLLYGAFYSTKPVIEGSESQKEFDEFQSNIMEYLDKAKELRNRYLDVYQKHSRTGDADMEESIRLANSINDVNARLLSFREKFILANPSSVVALEIFNEMVTGLTVKNTSAALDKMKNALAEYWAGNERFEWTSECCEKTKLVAIGEKYPDIELLDKNGKTVKLSTYVPEGKFVLLEFWASWCGPCRGEIPHLKKVYEKYAGKDFEIISISIDENDQDWFKALNEENMNWKQLRDSGGFEGVSADIYGVHGVPHCLLLDRNGIITESDCRGAFLDASLEKKI